MVLGVKVCKAFKNQAPISAPYLYMYPFYGIFVV
jgi:hypothetical protein